MDPRLLKYYNKELQFIREMGGEFAEEFPKIAGRLGLEGLECADPYVERLLEGFAFLTGRIQLKLDAEFPSFTQHLLEAVYPHYLSPTPSMSVVRLYPDLNESGLADGFTIPRHSVLRSLLGKSDQTSCKYRTAHEVSLWPIKLTKADYLATLAGTGLPDIPGAKAAIRLRLQCTAGLTFNKLALDRLPIYLQGADELPMRLYEQIMGNAIGMVARPVSRPAPWQEIINKREIKPLGFDDEQALLPSTRRSFQGYRLLHEYFAFPARYMFFEIGGLKPVVQRNSTDEMEIVILLSRSNTSLEKVFDANNFSLFCSPAINLFPKQCDRIHIDNKSNDYHVVPDRTRPMDFEIHSLNSVTGYGNNSSDEQPFLPFYSCNSQTAQHPDLTFYTVKRKPRQLSSKQRRNGPRSSYTGSETFISLVDGQEAPYSAELRQIGIDTLCSNRDLPLQIPIGKGNTDFTMESAGPVESIRAIAGPTRPKPTWAEGDVTWRLISHLSLNYLSLIDTNEEEGATALRELLTLYGDVAEAPVRKQISGVKSITSQAVARRIPIPGPITFGRGLEIIITLDEDAFEGTGAFLLGAVLERFFARYVSINSFTQTTIKTVERGEIMRWPLRTGQRHVL